MKQHLQIALDHEPLAWINGVVYSNRPAWYNVTARALHMDLIVPKERPHHAPQPAVLFLCGGAYMVMDRSIWLPELMTLARAGYTVASMEYRTSNEAAFPAALEDVKTAIRFLRAHAEEYCVDRPASFSWANPRAARSPVSAASRPGSPNSTGATGRSRAARYRASSTFTG